MVGVRPMPPPTRTLKPSSPASFLSNCRPTSYQPSAARSSSAPLMETLNLRGRKLNSGCSVLHWRRISVKGRSEEHTSELQSLTNLVCRLLLEKKKKKLLDTICTTRVLIKYVHL